MLDCFRAGEDGTEQHLMSYGPGDAFGELALLYNAPRAATIDSRSRSVLFSLDRETFNSVVKEAVIRKRALYDEFLKRVELFDSLNAYEREKICDVMQSRTYQNGEVIIRQGDEGNSFYCIQRGRAKVYMTMENGRQELVADYGQYDYFGELALLRDTPRAASVIADGECVVAFIDRPAFKRLFGPLEEILKRNTKRYDTYVRLK